MTEDGYDFWGQTRIHTKFKGSLGGTGRPYQEIKGTEHGEFRDWGFRILGQILKPEATKA